MSKNKTNRTAKGFVIGLVIFWLLPIVLRLPALVPVTSKIQAVPFLIQLHERLSQETVLVTLREAATTIFSPKGALTAAILYLVYRIIRAGGRNLAGKGKKVWRTLSRFWGQAPPIKLPNPGTSIRISSTAKGESLAEALELGERRILRLNSTPVATAYLHRDCAHVYYIGNPGHEPDIVLRCDEPMYGKSCDCWFELI